jgi:hypothetical protein
MSFFCDTYRSGGSLKQANTHIRLQLRNQFAHGTAAHAQRICGCLEGAQLHHATKSTQGLQTRSPLILSHMEGILFQYLSMNQKLEAIQFKLYYFTYRHVLDYATH